MSSYIEPIFIEKFFRESGFSNFGHVTVFREMQVSILAAILKRWNVFADLWFY